MTKILSIEGTDIRLEIEECGDCPLSDGEQEYCHLDDIGDIRWADSPPSKCPLPEMPLYEKLGRL